MKHFAVIVVTLVYLHGCFSQHLQNTSPLRLSPVVLRQEDNHSCALDTKVLTAIKRNITHKLWDLKRPCSCGGHGWTRIAYINMSDTNSQCPSTLTLHTTPVRGCGRRSSARYACDSVIFPVRQQYSRVCGRILAYQKGTPDAFHNSVNLNYSNINQAYLDGISLTHGAAGSRQHVWSFAAGINQGDRRYNGGLVCPCTDVNFNWPHQVPSFVGSNYFCDTADLDSAWTYSKYYTDNPLWDGKGCAPQSTCCEFNHPPWFCTSLPQNTTTDDIEMRKCYGDYGTSNEDVIIYLLEIYVS